MGLVKYSTVLNCRGVELYVRVEVFPPIYKMVMSKQNDILELSKFSLKMRSLNIDEGRGWPKAFFAQV